MRALTLQNGHRPAAAQCSVPAGSLGLSRRPRPSSFSAGAVLKLGCGREPVAGGSVGELRHARGALKCSRPARQSGWPGPGRRFLNSVRTAQTPKTTKNQMTRVRVRVVRETMAPRAYWPSARQEIVMAAGLSRIIGSRRWMTAPSAPPTADHRMGGSVLCASSERQDLPWRGSAAEQA